MFFVHDMMAGFGLLFICGLDVNVIHVSTVLSNILHNVLAFYSKGSINRMARIKYTLILAHT